MAKRVARQEIRPPWIADTKRQALEFFGVQAATLNDWIKSGCPAGPPYDLRAIYRWQRDRAGLRNRGAGGKADREQLECEKLELGNELARLKLAKETGELVDREAAKAAFASLLHRIRQRLEQLPHELASVLPADQRADYTHDAQHKVRLVCRELANWSIAEATDGGG